MPIKDDTVADAVITKISGNMPIAPRQRSYGTNNAFMARGTNESNKAEDSFRLASESFYPICKLKNIGAGSNRKIAQLTDIYKALYSMSVLPDEHSFHLNSKSASSARNLLALMAENFEFELPKLLNRDRDAVSFTWNLDSGKIYLTVDEKEVDLFAMLPEGQEIEEQISDGETIDLIKLFHLMGEQSNATILR